MPDMTDSDLRIGSLCTGYGGLDMAAQAAFGGATAWHADIDPGASAVLAHRWPRTPNLGDITAVDWSAVEPVDILTAGFPCQDVSVAGLRAGLTEGTRSGLWREVVRAIRYLRPRLVVIENVRGLLSSKADRGLGPDAEDLDENAPAGWVLRALGAVLGDLADLRFNAEWTVVRASDVGAPHQRSRVFVLAWPAYAESTGREGAHLGGRRPAGIRAIAADTNDLGGNGRTARIGQAGREITAGHLVADAGRGGRGARERDVQPGQSDAEGRAPADVARLGRREGRPEPAGQQGRPRVAVSGGAAPSDAPGRGDAHGPLGDSPVQLLAEPGSGGRADAGRPAPGTDDLVRSAGVLAWGNYEPAIRHWEHVLGRPAPAAVDARNRLSPAFVEWLMGLPAGHVTGVPGLSRTRQLKALGNGVVPQQAAAAIRILLARATAADAA